MCDLLWPFCSKKRYNLRLHHDLVFWLNSIYLQIIVLSPSIYIRASIAFSESFTFGHIFDVCSHTCASTCNHDCVEVSNSYTPYLPISELRECVDPFIWIWLTFTFNLSINSELIKVICNLNKFFYYFVCFHFKTLCLVL